MSFKTFYEFFVQNGGFLLTILGAALATILPGIGSAKGVGMVGEAASGVITEDPDKFGPSLILQAIPGTQGFYGFVSTLIILSKIGILGGGLKDISMVNGFYLLCASLPVSFVCWRSAISQGKTAVTGVSILAKRPDHVFKGVIYAAMVETYAVISLITSIIMITAVKL